MARTDPQIALRIPVDLKARVVAGAEANNRSINAEICFQLEQAYRPIWSKFIPMASTQIATDDRMDRMAGNS